MSPLVSAIMPTRGRQQWAHDALYMFLLQTWEPKEIVIIDDADDPAFPRVPEFPGVRYYARERMTIGEKRNTAIDIAAGRILMHWDTDDTYSSDRMESQARALLSHDVEMTGYNVMLFVDEDAGKRYIFSCAPERPIGVSLCYWRRAWYDRPFEAKQIGEDSAFSVGRVMYSCSAENKIVARMHADNTSEKRRTAAAHPEQWVEIPWEDA